MPPQSFLGLFGGTAQRPTNMVHYKCCVPINNNVTFLELQLFSTILFNRWPVHHVFGGSRKRFLERMWLEVVQVPARLEHGKM